MSIGDLRSKTRLKLKLCLTTVKSWVLQVTFRKKRKKAVLYTFPVSCMVEFTQEQPFSAHVLSLATCGWHLLVTKSWCMSGGKGKKSFLSLNVRSGVEWGFYYYSNVSLTLFSDKFRLSSTGSVTTVCKCVLGPFNNVMILLFGELGLSFTNATFLSQHL